MLEQAINNAVNMDKIYGIESSMNPLAFNKGSQARGLGQITPIVLKEWNNFFPKRSFKEDDLFKPEINREISNWYMNVRIPQMLKAFKIKDEIKNRLISYNAGIGYLRSGKPLPLETVNYINKYNK